MDNGIPRHHINYLVGRNSFYSDTHKQIHDLPVCAVGIALSKLCHNSNIEHRTEAYELVGENVDRASWTKWWCEQLETYGK
jgi:hypothetical protein